MEKLRKELDRLIDRLEDADNFRARLEDLVSVYPFNEYEYIISTLLGRDKLTLDEYIALRDAYIDRNLYLYIFEISAPRGFGDRWALGHLKELVPDFRRPSKALDSDYSGEYDLWLEPGIRVEVKASRAVDFESDEPLYEAGNPDLRVWNGRDAITGYVEAKLPAEEYLPHQRPRRNRRSVPGCRGGDRRD